jgi:amphi-Trp domain-containing protein
VDNGAVDQPIEVEKSYGREETIAKLQRLVDSLEQGKPFQIQIGGQRIVVPPDAEIIFEFEASDEESELEIEIKWKPNKG